MIEQVVRLSVDLTVNEGQLAEFKSIAQAMTAVSRSEPGTLGYEWFSSADGKRFRLLEAYVGADAVLAHFMGAAVQDLVPKLLAFASVTGFQVYGDPGPEVSQMAAGFGAEIFKYWLGIDR
jgi:quinol monooxygenase YgiN